MQASGTTAASNELGEFFNEHVGEPSRPRRCAGWRRIAMAAAALPAGGFVTLRGVGCVVRSVPRKGHGRGFIVRGAGKLGGRSRALGDGPARWRGEWRPHAEFVAVLHLDFVY